MESKSLAELQEEGRKAKEYIELLEPYPPFSGLDIKCSKCDSFKITTEFQREKLGFHGSFDLVMPHPERMRRKCHSCDFVWYEAPVSS